IGLSSYHTRAHLARAVMEGVAFAVRQAVEITQELGGSVETIIGSGGGVEADVWRGILVDVIGLPLKKSLMKEQTGVGAAALAGVGAGVYASFDELAARVAVHGEPYHPNEARHSFYNERYEQFTALYPTLKADLNRLAQS
ncbi:MAG: FGGY-family carbohydrate kinase, partial [Chloroflexota bacterium]